jgi:uncharacterized protein (DUF111 family)
LQEGALDTYFTPVQMKKGRPGVLLSVLCRPSDKRRIATLIFKETTTLGLRSSKVNRLVLDRELRKTSTSYGEVRVKTGRFDGEIVNLSLEFEDLKRIALETGLPLKVLKQRLLNELER